jgi:Carboxypeptidase regulatory-like domain
MYKAIIALVTLTGIGVLILLATQSDMVEPPDGAVRSRDGSPPSESADESPGETVITPDAHVDASRHLAQGAGAIHGRVWRDERPAAAVVELHVVRRTHSVDLPETAPPPLVRLRTGADGTFRISGLDTGDFELRARADGGAFGRADLRIYRGNTVNVGVILRDAPPFLLGRARYADGRVFAGLAIIGSRGAEVDDEGRFRLDDLVPGRHGLLLLVPGRIRIVRWVTLPRKGEYEVVVDEGLTEVRGRVVAAHDESPVAGATLRGMAGLFETTATSDTNGAFVISLPEGAGLTATAKGFSKLRYTSWGGNQEVVLRLVRAGRIEGRVLASDDGRALSGVDVYEDPSRFFGRERDEPAAVSGEDGRYVIEDLPAGSAYLLAWGRGWVSEAITKTSAFAVNPLAVKVKAGETTVHDLRVVRTGRIEGRVTGPDGKPVAGASVQAEPRSGRMRALAPWTVTGADGAYLIEGVMPVREHEVRVTTAAGLRCEHPEPVAVDPGGSTRVDLVVPVARWLRLLVTDADTGDPVVMAGVTVRQPGRQLHFLTGEDGVVDLGPLDPVDGWYRVDHGRYLCPAQSQEIPAEHVGGFALRLQRGHHIGGRVEPPPGVEGFEAYAHIVRTRELSRFALQGSKLDAEGRFRLGPVPAGTHDVVILAARPRQWSSVPTPCVAGTDDHVIIMPPPPPPKEPEARQTLAIRWVGPDGRRPMGGRAVVFDAEGSGRRLDSGGIGEASDAFECELQPGVRNVLIEVGGARTIGGAQLGSVLHGPIPATAGEVTIRLPAGRTIEGHLVDEAGKGISGITVRAEPAWREEPGTGGGTVTDLSGRFLLTGLGDTKYRITVLAPFDRARVAERIVPAGTKNLRLVCPGAVTAVFVLLGPDGEPARGVMLTAIPIHSRGGRVSNASGKNGRVELPHIVPGTAYDLRATASSREAPNLALLLTNVIIGTERTTIRLEAGHVIRGRIRGASRAVIHARLEDSLVVARMSEDGTFELRGLTAETWTVTVYARNASPPREVRAGGFVEFDFR